MRSVFEAKVQTPRLKLSDTNANLLSNIDGFDWILFTSKNAVEYFGQELHERKFRWSKNIRIAAVGPVTAKAVKKLHRRVDAIPEKSTLKNMIKVLGTIRGKKILFPRSAIAQINVVRAMRKAGAKVTVVPLYTTKPVRLSGREKNTILNGQYLYIVFKSPSGIRGFIAQFTTAQKRTVKNIQARCIGPTTAAAARKAGFRNVLDSSI